MFYKRKIYTELLSHAQTPFATVLTGMRRTGKTTLVQRLLLDLPNKNSLFIAEQLWVGSNRLQGMGLG